MTTKEIAWMVIRLGIGATMLILGTILVIVGVFKSLDWPQYIISGSVILFTGLIATCLDIIKDILKINLEKRKLCGLKLKSGEVPQ